MNMESASPVFVKLAPTAAQPRRPWARLGLKLGGGLLVLTAAMGVLHLPFGAPVLRRIMPGSVCPVMRGTPEQIDRAHAIGAAAIRVRASTAAPARFALGFQLDGTRRAEIQAWAAKYGVSCKAIAGNDNLMRCTDVPAAALQQPADLGTLEEVTLELKGSGELVNVQTMRRHLTPDQAATTASRLERAAVRSLGAPSSTAGEASAPYLSRAVLSTYVAEHAFKDYRATVSATNLPPTGVMVREEYLSAR